MTTDYECEEEGSRAMFHLHHHKRSASCPQNATIKADDERNQEIAQSEECYEKRTADNETPFQSGLSSLLRHQSAPFPLPSFCIFSQAALADESADNQDIVRYVYPDTVSIDRASILASVAEPLVRAVEEFAEDSDEEHEDEDEDEDEDETEALYRVLGLSSFKAVLSMTLPKDWDMAMVTILPPHVSDETIRAYVKDLVKVTPELCEPASDHTPNILIPVLHQHFGTLHKACPTLSSDDGT